MVMNDISCLFSLNTNMNSNEQKIFKYEWDLKRLNKNELY